MDADSEATLPWPATASVPGPSLHQAVMEHGPLPLLTVFRRRGVRLAGIAVVVVLVISPQKVLDWVKSDGKSSDSPGYSAPTYSQSTDFATDTATATATDADTNTGTGAQPTEEETSDPGCDRGKQAIVSDNETFDEASAASLRSLASNLDAAADAADDPDVSSAIRALANDSRSMSDSAAGAQVAIDRNDAAQGQVYADAFSAGVKQSEKDADTYKSLCT
ncbi:hypothetical protein ACWDBW_38250 [Streptomyces sp. NPDC001107]